MAKKRSTQDKHNEARFNADFEALAREADFYDAIANQAEEEDKMMADFYASMPDLENEANDILIAKSDPEIDKIQ